MTAKTPMEEVREKLSGMVNEFNQSINPLRTIMIDIGDVGKKVSSSINNLADDVSELSGKNKLLSKAVDDLSQEVSSLEDLVSSNKDLSAKIERLIEKGGISEQMSNNIITILTKPEGDFNKLIGNYFSELMEGEASVKAISISFNSAPLMEDLSVF